MITKDKLINAIQKLPDEFSMDDVLEELMLLQKIETGLVESDKGETISDADLDNELPEWLN